MSIFMAYGRSSRSPNKAFKWNSQRPMQPPNHLEREATLSREQLRDAATPTQHRFEVFPCHTQLIHPKRNRVNRIWRTPATWPAMDGMQKSVDRVDRNSWRAHYRG